MEILRSTASIIGGLVGFVFLILCTVLVIYAIVVTTLHSRNPNKKNFFSLKTLNIVAAYIGFVCNIMFSYDNLIQLIQTNGFDSSWQAQAFVFIIVILSMVGLTNTILSSVRLSTYLSGAIGLFFLIWSNIVAGWAYGLINMIIGILFPLLLVLLVWMARESYQNHEHQKPTEEE